MYNKLEVFYIKIKYVLKSSLNAEIGKRLSKNLESGMHHHFYRLSNQYTDPQHCLRHLRSPIRLRFTWFQKDEAVITCILLRVLADLLLHRHVGIGFHYDILCKRFSCIRKLLWWRIISSLSIHCSDLAATRNFLPAVCRNAQIALSH